MPDDFLMREYEDAKARASARLTMLVMEQLGRLNDGLGGRIDPLHPRWALLVALASDLIRAGFSLHDCAADAPEGGVCLTPRRAGGGPAMAGAEIQIILTWNQHAAASYSLFAVTEVQESMNGALADVASTLGYEVEALPDATSQVWMVTGRRPPEPEPDAE